MTAKQLEKKTGCRIMIRGKSSVRDEAKVRRLLQLDLLLLTILALGFPLSSECRRRPSEGGTACAGPV